MENKQLGIIILALALVLGLIMFTFSSSLAGKADLACSCTEMEAGQPCPHEMATPWQLYAGIVLISALVALSAYLIFFEKSQKEIISTLEKQKHMQITEEKFDILFKGLSKDEQKVVSAIREQDGITQQTLRLRTDMHKSKLSILLDALEKKGIIKRVRDGKTNKVFMKLRL